LESTQEIIKSQVIKFETTVSLGKLAMILKALVNIISIFYSVILG